MATKYKDKKIASTRHREKEQRYESTQSNTISSGVYVWKRRAWCRTIEDPVDHIDIQSLESKDAQ